MTNIKISPKHGLNSSLLCCFWCGEPTGIALVGRLPQDAEAPKKIVTDYEPCDKCKENNAMGILLVEGQEVPPRPNMPPIQTKGSINLYPTGNSWVITEEATRRLIDEPMLSSVLIARKTFIDAEVAKKLGLKD